VINLGGYPLYTKGEPREAVTIFDIVHGGGWILPMRAGVEIPSKPLLMHWLAALLSIAAGGVNEWTVRLPSAILAIAAMIACYLYVRRLFDAPSALLSALMLGTSFQYLQAGSGARVDATLTFFITIAFFEFIAIAEELSNRWLLLYVAIAGAVLTKGPVGALLPGAVAIVWITYERRWGVIGRLHLLLGVAIVAIVGGGWYLAAAYVGGLDFLRKQLLAENVTRFLGGPEFREGHAHPFYYVELTLLAGFMPWTLLIPAPALRFARAAHPLGPRLRYLIIWFLTVLIFYNLAHSKRSVYLLALYPALTSMIALSMGAPFSAREPHPVWMRALARSAGAVLIVAGLAAVAATVILKVNPAGLAAWFARLGIRASGFTPAFERAIAAHESAAMILPLATAAIGLYLAGARPGSEATVAAIAAAVACITLITNLFVLPAIANTIGLKDFTAGAMKIVAQQPVAYLDGLNYEVAFYSGRSIPVIDLGDRMAPAYLLCGRDAYEAMDLVARSRFEIALASGPTDLDGGGGMLLLRGPQR
jgi:4-amino-4-deoxy-L-arabinose transferase-like glycosyltransferase